MMKKRRLRMISALFALCLLLSAAPLTGFVGLEIAPRAEAYSVGDHIEFGTYPQSRVTDETLIAQLDATPKTWKSYNYYSGTGEWDDEKMWDDGKMAPSDYMRFSDFFVGDAKYRAVTFDEYRPIRTSDTQSASNSFQDENGYTPNIVYYFLYEPIFWRILDPADGLILSEMLLDAQAYQNTVYTANNRCWQNTSCNTYASDYATSYIRDWLNYDFYETAFTDAQKANILNDVALNNSAQLGGAEYNSASTKDKIFLLSYAEATNGAYGLAGNTIDTARQAMGSDYAQAQGLYVCGSGYYTGRSVWWLRSPYYSYGAGVVAVTGYVGTGDDFSVALVGGTYEGVRAACRLSNLKSDISQSQTLFSENDDDPGSEYSKSLDWRIQYDDTAYYTNGVFFLCRRVDLGHAGGICRAHKCGGHSCVRIRQYHQKRDPFRCD